MIAIFDDLRALSFSSVVLRLLISVLCGGLVGLEREYKRRGAGFRTHILICLGAAMTTMTSIYLLLYMQYHLDAARLGAGVIAGMGFIGAGTIIVTRRQRVKGLTTAAGLWTVAIVGLAAGAGFYEGAITATVLILMAELYFSKIEYRILADAPEINLYLEYLSRANLERLLSLFRDRQVKVSGMEITRQSGEDARNASAIFTLRLNRQCKVDELLQQIRAMDGIINVEEL